MTTKPKGAGKALRFSMPAAAETWHFIPGVPGLYHPIHITPIESVGLDAETAKVLVDNESMPLEWADATDDDIKSANKELLKASEGALGGVRHAARVAGSEEEERERIRAGATAAQAVNTKTDEKEN